MLESLRELNVVSMLLRMAIAMAFGGLVGLEREHKRMPAGFRTYMLVCLGASLAMMLSQYQFSMLHTRWADVADRLGVNTDVARYGAQVINGIGFLAAGTIIVNEKREIKGVTTAAGLWACACMGIAVGSGFYECAIAGLLLIYLSVRLMPRVEEMLAVHSKDITLYVEFFEVSDVGKAVRFMNHMRLELLEMEFGPDDSETEYPNAMVRVNVPSGIDKSEVVMRLSALKFVHAIHRAE